MNDQKDRDSSDIKRIEQNQLINMSMSSGEEARRARGKKDIELPSQQIANNPNIGQVISSGSEAQKKRQTNKKDWSKGAFHKQHTSRQREDGDID